jgi:hypothetical protein
MEAPVESVTLPEIVADVSCPSNTEEEMVDKPSKKIAIR